MHELPVTRSICEIVLRHAARSGAVKVLSVKLEVGALSDLQPEWVQRYFDYVSRGTAAEGARLDITKVPATFGCNRCGSRFEVASFIDEGIACDECRAEEVRLLSGTEYLVSGIEVI